MHRDRRQALVALGFMCATFAAARAWQPDKHLADQRPAVKLEDLFPRQFGDWAVDTRQPVQLVSPDIQAFIDKIYSQTISRTYIDSRGRRVMLSVAYGGDQSDATRAHRPEVCYPAQGFQIISSRRNEVEIEGRAVRVRQLVAKLGSRVEPISYWIVVGEHLALTGTEQKLAQLGYTTRGLIPDGMLVRVSTIDAEVQRAFDLQVGFLREMAAAISPPLRNRVIGAVQT